MRINEKKAYQVVETLHAYFQKEDTSLYATIAFPNTITYKSNEWIIYMFYSCLLDYGMKSIQYHQNLIATYSKIPEIFDPKYITTKFKGNSEPLLNLMKENIHPRYPNIALKKWLKLSEELSKYEDIGATLRAFQSYEEVELFIKNIHGYGQKTGGLLLRTLYEAGDSHSEKVLPSIPIDRHDIEISYRNHVIDSRKLTQKEIRELSNIYIECGKELNIKSSSIDKYLWEVGTRFCNKKQCLSCPLFKNCHAKIKDKEESYV